MAISIQIRPHPFESKESTDLIAALDEDLLAMFPDWADLPQPGADINLETGLQNPKPALQPLDSLDAVPDLTTEVSSSTVKSKSFTELVKVTSDGLHFFVAFARSTVVNDGGPSDEEEQVVGCVALRLLPYFPFHHPATAYDASRREPVQAQIDEEKKSGMKTAELKRMYVIPSYRGSKVIKPGVAVQLLDYAAEFAREEMGVRKLVLETGDRQHAAIKLYEREGWMSRECFGDFITSRTEIGGVSLCYEKMI